MERHQEHLGRLRTQSNFMSNKLQKIAPAWHGQIAAELIREFSEVNELSETARRRRLRLGFMFIFVKESGKADESIPHGTFGEWLEKNCPAIPRRTVGDYLTEAKSVMELLKWQNGEIRHFEPHRLMLAKEESLTVADKQRKAKLLKIADQEGHFRAVTQYKQVELKDDATTVKVGRRHGEGGNSKDALAKSALVKEIKSVEALETWMHAATGILKKHCTLAGFPKAAEVKGGDRTFAEFSQAIHEASLFLKSLKKT